MLAEVGQSLRAPGVVERPRGHVHRGGGDVCVRVGHEERSEPVGEGHDVVGAGVAGGLAGAGRLLQGGRCGGEV